MNLTLCLYQQLWRIAPPLIRHYLRKRGKKNPAYLQHWGERFGEPFAQPVKNAIWIHAVSVGETRAALPLVQALRPHFPDAPLLLTQMTPTGRATAQQLFPDAQCRYLPYDKPEYVAQFLAEHQPRLGILMETEIWPNLIHACQQHHLPLFLANARLSEKSQRGYQHIQAAITPALNSLTACFAQTNADAERLRALGVQHIEVCGNTKYDFPPPPELAHLAAQLKQQAGQRPIIVCGSTRVKNDTDEAELLLQAWQGYSGHALLVIVPRHPECFDAVYQTACRLGFRCQRRSEQQAIAPDTQVWLGDSMGELLAFYQIADIAFVGGSLVDTGCQNIIEPIAYGIPTLFGFSTYNFAATCQAAVAAGAAQQILSAQAWRHTVEDWLQHPTLRQTYAQQAKQFIQAHQGASQKIAALIKQAVA